MLRRSQFGAFEPDQPLGVNTALNVWPLPNGFRPVRQFAAITPVLAGILGGAAYVSSEGTSVFLSGTTSNLYRFSGASWTSVRSGMTATVWRFSQFGDLIIGVNGAAPVKFDMIAGTAAALGGSPPASDLVATVRQQVFLAGNPSETNLLTISGYNDSEGYTPGTNQSLAVPFPNGGEITGLAGGETGIILQRHSIKRASYTGDVTVWQFDEISSEIGCIAKGSVAQTGQMVFFLSTQGFMACDRNTVIPIGREKVDRTFFARYTGSDIQKITAAVDPRSTTVVWAMPGDPGRLWAYDYTLQKWSIIDLPLTVIFPGFTANISVDAADAIFTGGSDAVPYSPDSPVFQGGDPLFLVADRAGAVGALTGANMSASIITDPAEPEPGKRVRIQGARVIGDIVEGTVTLDCRARAGDASATVISGAMRDNGRVPLRANGRHVGMTVDIPACAAWSYIQGIDIEYAKEGGR